MHVNSVVSFWMILGCTCASIWAAENIGMPVLIPSNQLGSHNNVPKQITLNTQRGVPYHALVLQKNAFKPALVTPPIPTTPLQAQRRQDIPQPQYRPPTNSAVQRPPPQAPAQRAPLVKTTPLSTSVSHTVNNAQPRPVGNAPVRSLQQPGFHTKTTGKVVLSNQRQSATILRPVQQSAPYQRSSSTSFSKGGSNSFPEGFSKGLPSFDFGGGFPGPPIGASTPTVRKRLRVRRGFRWPFLFSRRRKDKYIKNERLRPAPPNDHHHSFRTRPRPAPPLPPNRRNQVLSRRPPPLPFPPKPIPLPQDQSSEVPAYYVQRFSPSTNSYTRLKRRPPYKAPVQRPKRPRPQYGAPPSRPSSSYGAPAPAPSPSYSSSTVGVAQTTSQTTYGSASPSYGSVSTLPQASYGVSSSKTNTDLNTAARPVSGSGDNDFGLVIQMKFPKAALSSPTSIATPLDAYGKIDIDPIYSDSDTDDDKSQRNARDVTETGNGFIDGKPANFPSLKTLGGFDSPFDSPKDFKYSASNQKPTKVIPPSIKPALRNSETSKLRVPAKGVALDHEFSRAKRGNTAPQASAGPVPSSSSASAPPKPTYPQSINDILNSKDDETDNSPRHPPREGHADIILDTSFFAKRLGKALDVADDEAFLEPDDFQPPINATDIDYVISAASHSEDILEVAEQRFNPSIGPFGSNGRPSPQAATPTGRPPSPTNSFSSFRQRPLPPKFPSVDPQRVGNIRKPFSRNFDVVTGGLYRDTSDYRRPIRPFPHNNHFYDDHSHEEEDDFFSNFRDFADINHRRRGEHSQNKKRPVWSSDASYEEEDSDY